MHSAARLEFLLERKARVEDMKIMRLWENFCQKGLRSEVIKRIPILSEQSTQHASQMRVLCAFRKRMTKSISGASQLSNHYSFYAKIFRSNGWDVHVLFCSPVPLGATSTQICSQMFFVFIARSPR
jgi:hypothetical protein